METEKLGEKRIYLLVLFAGDRGGQGKMQPFMIVLPLFVSVFVVRVLPRILLAPVALLMLWVLNWRLNAATGFRQGINPRLST